MTDLPRCPDCKLQMEGGFLLDKGSSESKALPWVEGAPEKSFWGYLKTKGRRTFTVYGWRCPNCSLLRLYAPEEEE